MRPTFTVGFRLRGGGGGGGGSLETMLIKPELYCPELDKSTVGKEECLGTLGFIACQTHQSTEPNKRN
jgi:hypothetical protein